MSMNFDNPMNKETRDKITEMIEKGDLPVPVASDEKTLLFDEQLNLQAKKMADLANTAKQPLSVEVNGVDVEGNADIKELSDGTKYKVTPRGWQKVE